MVGYQNMGRACLVARVWVVRVWLPGCEVHAGSPDCGACVLDCPVVKWACLAARL